MAKRSDVIRPSWGWFALLDGGLAALAVLALSERAHTKVTEDIGFPIPSQKRCQSILLGAAVVHVAEGLAAGPMARRRGISPKGWRVQSLVVGFPSLRLLRRLPPAAPPDAG